MSEPAWLVVGGECFAASHDDADRHVIVRFTATQVITNPVGREVECRWRRSDLCEFKRNDSWRRRQDLRGPTDSRALALLATKAVHELPHVIEAILRKLDRAPSVDDLANALDGAGQAVQRARRIVREAQSASED